MPPFTLTTALFRQRSYLHQPYLKSHPGLYNSARNLISNTSAPTSRTRVPLTTKPTPPEQPRPLDLEILGFKLSLARNFPNPSTTTSASAEPIDLVPAFAATTTPSNTTKSTTVTSLKSAEVSLTAIQAQPEPAKLFDLEILGFAIKPSGTWASALISSTGTASAPETTTAQPSVPTSSGRDHSANARVPPSAPINSTRAVSSAVATTVSGSQLGPLGPRRGVPIPIPSSRADCNFGPDDSAEESESGPGRLARAAAAVTWFAYCYLVAAVVCEGFERMAEREKVKNGVFAGGREGREKATGVLDEEREEGVNGSKTTGKKESEGLLHIASEAEGVRDQDGRGDGKTSEAEEEESESDETLAALR
ncbi:hypothetical protein MBLNU230_g7274t1 [Neophaeotheca triangularis]